MEKAKVNIYFIENNTSKLAKEGKGGQFYNVYKNVGDVLEIEDLKDLNDDLFELETSLYNIDPTFKKVGGIILKRNEEISSLSVFEVNDNKYSLQSIEASRIKVFEMERLRLIRVREELIQKLKINSNELALIEKEVKELIK